MHELLFVYGTLRKNAAGRMYKVLARYGEYFAEGCMRGRLYDVNGYPGAVESERAKDKVYGEIYRLTRGKRLLVQLDAYEGCSKSAPEPHEYIRKKVRISLCDREKVSAWVYIFNHDVSNLVRIPSGDYLNYLDESRRDSTRQVN